MKRAAPVDRAALIKASFEGVAQVSVEHVYFLPRDGACVETGTRICALGAKLFFFSSIFFLFTTREKKKKKKKIFVLTQST
jgi:hypothetical protein